MGSFFSSAKRPRCAEADSVSSTNPTSLHPSSAPRHTNDVPAPPLKRRRIDPQNDTIPPVVAPPRIVNQTFASPSLLSTAVPSAVPTQPSQPALVPVPNLSSRLRNDGQRIQAATQRSRNAAFLMPRQRLKKRRFALFLGYVGEKYHGMQVNPEVTTIEELLMKAFHKANLTSDANHFYPQKIGLMRAARTDKGVSAAGQCVSVKFELTPELQSDLAAVVKSINNHLPRDIRIYGLQRVTPAFNARQDCHRRRYEYIFPLRLLGGPDEPQTNAKDPGAQDSRIQKFSAILKQYEGSHCFANFTEGLASSNDSSRRYMVCVTCKAPFIPPGSEMYYVVVELIGQSFLLHQIRKMIGLALVVYHGHAPGESISVALCPEVRFPTPIAPAEGLLLDTLYFDQYSARFKGILGHAISDEEFKKAKDSFKLHKIYHRIAEKERHNQALELWVNTCQHRMPLSSGDILKMYEKYVRTDVGKKEQHEAYIASLYPIRTDVEPFLNLSPRAEKVCCLADRLREEYMKRYGTAASFIARAPGRVILIGEHLDYNGFSVISAATFQSTMVAGCLDATRHIEIQHMEDETYCAARMDVNGRLDKSSNSNSDDKRDKRWLDYVSGGVKVLAAERNYKRMVSGGGRILVAGDLPRARGLASSSSLATVSVLTAARLGRKRLPKTVVATLAAEGERGAAGTQGGCVDHVTSMCADKNCVVLTSFVPKLDVNLLKWPKGVRLFAVGSRICAEKGGDEFTRSQFNLRAAECRIAAAILARRLHVHLAKAITTPGQLFFNARKTGKLGCKSISILKNRAGKVMHENERLTLNDVRKELGVNEVELRNRFLIGTKAEIFEVGKRMTHVFSEAERVEEFVNTLKAENLDVQDQIAMMGRILNEGHRSLQQYYESSVGEVDDLVEFCRKHGAVGSRMTGAGWGGYIVNIVPDEKASQFVTSVVGQVGAPFVLEISPWYGAVILAFSQTESDARSKLNRHQKESKDKKTT